MNTERNAEQVAQPAPEEIKKHGDQLARQVKDAAGTQKQAAEGEAAGDERDP